MMKSHAYRQSSQYKDNHFATDPNNEYYWRFNKNRMTLEQMRDSMLQVSGALDSTMGGKPFQIKEYVPRRTVYAKVDRNMIPDVFINFDAGNLSSSLAKRPVSSVPQQALYLMNDPFVMKQSQKIASAPQLNNLEGQAWVKGLYHKVLARDPSPTEIERVQAFLKTQNVDLPLIKTFQWQYGFGHFDPQTRNVDSFQKFEFFNGKAWRMRGKYPHPKYKYLDISATGGHVGGEKHTSVRRWTSPFSGELIINGELIHGRECGDGVYGIIQSSSKGLLGEWHAFKEMKPTTTKLNIEEGEVIDFIVYCGKSTTCDSYKWDPTLRLQTDSEFHVWQASEQFVGPKDHQKLLNQRDALAQILLMSNEFHFID